uniref:HMA domain-containing protein n=1 Tax=Leersia perrieri TaxID=77586 RepID=A0A0D9W616_9ORYZ
MKEIIIRMRPDSDNCHHKALKVAAAVSGVESVTVTGRDRELLVVIGDGVDESKLTKKLRREVGEAEILELRTLDARRGGGVAVASEAAPSLQLLTPAGAKGGGAVVFAQPSPYHHWHHPTTPGRSVNGGGRVTFPVTTHAVASPGAAARWPGGEHYRSSPQAALYYPRTPNAQYLYGGMGERGSSSPMAGGALYAGGGSSYARAVARSHPANYSPMVERHDYGAVGRGERRRRRAGRQPNCCSIL